jgi:hypothetical protein
VAVVSTTFVKLTIACVSCESTSSAIVITSGNSKRKSFVALLGVPQTSLRRYRWYDGAIWEPLFSYLAGRQVCESIFSRQEVSANLPASNGFTMIASASNRIAAMALCTSGQPLTSRVSAFGWEWRMALTTVKPLPGFEQF